MAVKVPMASVQLFALSTVLVDVFYLLVHHWCCLCVCGPAVVQLSQSGVCVFVCVCVSPRCPTHQWLSRSQQCQWHSHLQR